MRTKSDNNMPMRLTPFIYIDHLSPNGLLPSERLHEASAAWHCAKLIIIALTEVPAQATMEGDVDQTIRLRNIADSVCLLYDVDIETMMSFMDFVKAEAWRCGLPWPSRIDAWLATGGKSYDEVTREEKTLNLQ
jgi:hypothetical protein